MNRCKIFALHYYYNHILDDNVTDKLRPSHHNLGVGLLAGEEEPREIPRDFYNLGEREFQTHFRLSKSAVEILIDELSTLESNEISAGRPRTGIVDSILMTLWFCANMETYREIADRFGHERGASYRIIKRTLGLIFQLNDRYIVWPTGEKLLSTSTGFSALRRKSFPNVVGAIDGCHIKISVTQKLRTDYTNSKKFQSIILQAVCDAKLRFTNVFCGWPGSAHNARVFRNSPIGRTLISLDSQQPLLPTDMHILGDCAYPLLVNLLVPYRDNGFLTTAQKSFNKILSSHRVVIEQAFGLLYCRFRRLRHLQMHDITEMSQMVMACVVLHNFCLEHDGDFDIPVEINDVNMNINDIEYSTISGNIHAARKRAEITEMLALLNGEA